jgi:hypothetical protein
MLAQKSGPNFTNNIVFGTSREISTNLMDKHWNNNFTREAQKG